MLLLWNGYLLKLAALGLVTQQKCMAELRYVSVTSSHLLRSCGFSVPSTLFRH